MFKKIFFFLLMILFALNFSACSGGLGSFEQTEKTNLKLFEILDDSPALKSLFVNIDPNEFNEKLNNLIKDDPELMIHVMYKTADLMAKGDSVFGKNMASLSKSIQSLHNVYNDKQDDFNSASSIISRILDIEPTVMTDGVDSLISVLAVMKNSDTEFGTWDFFSPGQEMDSFGIDGIEGLISNLDIVNTLYGKQSENPFGSLSGFSDPGLFARNLFESINEEIAENPDYLKNTINDLIDSIENGGETGVDEVEKEIADWVAYEKDQDGNIINAANLNRALITNYLIEDLYPLVKDPKITGQSGEEFNFLYKGKDLLDKMAKLISSTPKSLKEEMKSTKTSIYDVNYETNNLKWFLGAAKNDLKLYNNLETIKILNFDKNEETGLVDNELLYWTKHTLVNSLNSALYLGSDSNAESYSDEGITKKRLREILWDGWTYKPKSGASTYFKGLMKVVDPGNSAPNENDGSLIRLAKLTSTDAKEKPFRRQVSQILNGTEAGHFKDINLDYSNAKIKTANDEVTGEKPESQLEAILTNIQLHLLSYYYSPKMKKWSLTSEQGNSEDYFDEPAENRNIQSYVSGLQTSLRNLVMLDINAKEKDAVGFKNNSMLNELLYVVGAGAGYVDPTNAPGDLTLENCLKSMGSPLASKDVYSVSVMGQVDMKVLGNNDIRRYPACDSPPDRTTWPTFATQNVMPVFELLQPGTFRTRTGGRSGTYGSGTFNGSIGNWNGKFSASQGDMRGVTREVTIPGTSKKTDVVNTSTWTVTEMALSGWEGYGPYTYKGKAPNGSECKYKNDYYTDWYSMKGHFFSDYGPGFRGRKGRYHIYEAVYRPKNGEVGFEDSGYTDKDGNPVAKYGYIRPNKSDGSYNNNSLAVNNKRVTLDCASRDEAIRKNFKWLLNQKKYMFMIPVHAATTHWVLILSYDIEIWAWATINANGIVGVTRAKRYNSNMSNNAKWNLSKIQGVVPGDNGNYFLKKTTSGEPTDTSRFSGVSFTDKDSAVAIDYYYKIDGWFSGIAENIAKMADKIWFTMGDYTVLPNVVGKAFDSLDTIANAEYSQVDILAPGYDADSSDINKFGKFYSIYYPNITNMSELKAKDRPSVPKVTGISYPTSYDEDGNVLSWKEHLGESNGKFEAVVGLLGMTLGTMHEDGDVYDVNDELITNSADIDIPGNVKYYAKNGFRPEIDELVDALASLNELKTVGINYRSDSQVLAAYNPQSLINILIDQDPETQNVVPGSKRGFLPTLLNSKYMNVNNIEPIKKGIEQSIQDGIKSYFNAFHLTDAGDGELQPYYVYQKNDDGEELTDVFGNKIVIGVNPEIDWTKNINKLRYLTSEKTLDFVKENFDFIKDLSSDPKFVKFIKKSIPAINNYLAVKKMSQDSNLTFEQAKAASFQLNVSDDDVDKIVDFIKDFEYDEFLEFVKKSGINDLEKFYNFSFESFGGEVGTAEIQKNLDELNSKLAQYFGYSIKEGVIDGIYELNVDVDDDFKAGDIVYGFGKYIEVSESSSDVITVTNDEGEEKHYLYKNIENFIKTNQNDESKINIKFEGIREYSTFRSDLETDFAENCEDYTDKWYRSGAVQCPNIFNAHKYDLRMDKLFEIYSEGILKITEDTFAINTAPEWETFGRDGQIAYSVPGSIIDILYSYSYDGNPTNQGNKSNRGLQIEDAFNYLKDAAFDKIYKTPVTIFDEDSIGTEFFGTNVKDSEFVENSDNKQVSLRSLIGIVSRALDENLYDYEYQLAQGTTLKSGTVIEAGTIIKAGSKAEDGTVYSNDYVLPSNLIFEEDYTLNGDYTLLESYQSVESSGTHKHMINNIIDFSISILNPESENYKTENLIEAWEGFNDAVQITTGELNSAREIIGALLYDFNKPENEKYTHMFADIATESPELLKAFLKTDENGNILSKYGYNDLIKLGLSAFSKDGIGSYLAGVMKIDSKYDSWEALEQLNELLKQDAFTLKTLQLEKDETFWWQMGNLLSDFGYIMEQQNGYQAEELDQNYYEEIRSIFDEQ